MAGPHVQDSHCGNSSAERRVLCVPRHGAAGCARLGARSTSAFWVGLHEALGASLIFCLQHHHNTTSKVERVNGVITDVLRSFAADRGNDWPDLVCLAEFAINGSASALG